VAFDAPFVGVGRGAFASAFVGHAGATERYVHPENLPVQWITEWGFPWACFALVSIVATIGRAWNQDIPTTQRSALVALGLLGTHDFVDFSLESLGVALPAAVLAIAATLPARHAESRPRTRRGLHHRPAGVMVGIGAIAMAVCALQVGVIRVEPLERSLGPRIRSGEDVAHELERATTGFPEEPVIALLGRVARETRTFAAGCARVPRSRPSADEQPDRLSLRLVRPRRGPPTRSSVRAAHARPHRVS
jgi:hypothetical protein